MTYEEAIVKIQTGKRYRHFKGNEYVVLCIGRSTETEEAMVVYKAQYGDGKIWVRPAGMWNDEVQPGVSRFELVEEDEAESA